MIHSPRGAHIFLFISAVINGANYSFAKNVMPTFIQPSGIIVIRGICTIFTFWLLDLAFGDKKPIERKDWKQLFFCAVTGIFINQLFFYNGLNYTTPIHAALMMLMAPFIILLISVFIVKESIAILQLSGLLLACLGAGWLILGKDIGSIGGSNIVLGDTLVFINAVSWGIFTVIVRPLVLKYNVFSLLKWIFFTGFFMILPFGLNDVLDIQWNTFTPIAGYSLAFLIVFGTILAYALNTYFLKFLSPVVAGSYAYLQPVTAAIFSLWMGKEVLTLEKVGCAGVILVGLFLLNKGKSKKQND